MRRYLTYLLFLLIAISCEKESVVPVQARLVSATLELSLSPEEIASYKEFDPRLEIGESYIDQPIDVYKLTYNTVNMFGEPIIASGVLALPKDRNQTYPLMSYQRGTIYLEEAAPSHLENGYAVSNNIFFIASAGYIVACSDYVGFGASANEPHPYQQDKGLAQPALDFLRAAKNFLAQENIQDNGKLFLAGYSEGGYATAALMKSIETEHENEFEITAVACGAGAYDMRSTIGLVKGLTLVDIGASEYLPLVFQAYNKLYLQHPTDFIFQQPYADLIDNGLLDGTYNFDEVLAAIPETMQPLFQPNFLDRFASGKEWQLDKALLANTLITKDWIPKADLQIAHGSADNSVYLFNANNFFEHCKKYGKQNIDLEIFWHEDHYLSRLLWYPTMMEYFKKSKQ